MLFLVFLHKIIPNCNVGDYKTAPFCIITYSCQFVKLVVQSCQVFLPDVYHRQQCQQPQQNIRQV